MKKCLLLIALIIVLFSSTIVFGQALDYEGHWAANEIDYMKVKGIIDGYPDGTFKPDNNMTKAEFYKVVNGLIGYTVEGEVKYEDVVSTDWFYGEIQKGVGANYLLASDKLNPNDKVTRGEVSRVVAFVFGVEEDAKTAEFFLDHASFPAELKGIIGGLRKNEFINGYPDGTFKPEGQITRAEVVKILHDIVGELINEAGTVSKDIKTNAVVNVGDVILKDMIIGGNLYLTEGVGEGNVSLDNVTVQGELVIKGGGAESVHIVNSKLGKVIIDKQVGSVRVVLENTSAEGIKTVNEVKLQLAAGTEVKVVELDGKVEVVIDKGATVLTLDAVSKEVVVEAKGKIESLVATKDIKVNGKTVKADTEVKIEGGKVEEIKPEEPKAPSTGGGGGGDDGPSGPVGPVTPEPTAEEKAKAEFLRLGKVEIGKTYPYNGVNANITQFEQSWATVGISGLGNDLATMESNLKNLLGHFINTLANAGAKKIQFGNGGWLDVNADNSDVIVEGALGARNGKSVAFKVKIRPTGHVEFEQDFTITFDVQ